MVTPSEQPLQRVPPEPGVLRRNLVAQLDRLPDESVAVLHDLAQELELRAAWSEFTEGMAQDWAAGKYEGLDQALVQARAALREPQAG